MKRQYVFLFLIFIILYLSYLIVSYKYKEYQTNNRIYFLEEQNNLLAQEIRNNKETLEFYNTKAYKNKLLKEEQSLKNKGEKVILIINEETFQTYTQSESNVVIQDFFYNEPNIYDSMTIFQKWIYFLFQKDIRK